LLSKSDVERIKEMGAYLDPAYIADVFKVPVDVIEDVLRGNIQGDEMEPAGKTTLKVVEKARFVRNKTVCAVSPGGGKGKTSVLVSLAILAALRNPTGRPVLAIDLAEFGKMPLHMGFRFDDERIMPSITQCSDNPNQNEIFEYLAVRHPQIDNLYLIPGVKVADMHERIETNIICRVLEVVQRHFELILVDLPARMDLWDEIVARTDMVLVVVSNDYPDIEGMAQLIPTLKRLGKEQQFLLVVNQNGTTGLKQGMFQRVLAGLCAREMPVDAWLPFESGLSGWLNGTENQHCILDNVESEYASELANLLSKLCPDWNLKTSNKKKNLLSWLRR
jgi:MinD-like ATPase involved in chromosome partitioning or flagellar assembly